MSKIYEKGETVWIKPLKREGEIIQIRIDKTKNLYVAMVTDSDNVWHVFDLNELDKLREKGEKPKPRIKTVPIQYSDDSLELTELEQGDWIDLRAKETITLKQFEYTEIDLGVAMRVPNGEEAHLKPRSSTYKKYGIIQTNGVGVIDNSYSGKDDIWKMPVVALRDTVIPKGERICQFRFVPKMNKDEYKYKKVNELRGENRGGFGSTGRK